MSVAYRRSWTPSEDEALISLVNTQGVKNWSEISLGLNSLFSPKNRSGKQCRERYSNHLAPSINKAAFTPEEDNLIYSLHKKFGKSWSAISKFLPGRTDNSVKNRFYSSLRKNLRKFNKSAPSSQKILGSTRAVLRNPEISELLLKDWTMENEAKCEVVSGDADEVNRLCEVHEDMNGLDKDASLLYGLCLSECFYCRKIFVTGDMCGSSFDAVSEVPARKWSIISPVIIIR